MTLEYQIILAGHSFVHFENTILFEFQLIGLEMRDIEIAAIVGEIWELSLIHYQKNSASEVFCAIEDTKIELKLLEDNR